jgi:NAD(P)-dependent dehydrogenase (short-subunit alcohol dehydrogenase family)
METVVIGAGSGMGAAVARRLAARGPLVAVDSNVAAVEALARELGGEVEARACDVTRPEEIGALASSLDRVGSLVITAGISAASMLPGRLILEVNLLGTARILTAFDGCVGPGTAAVCFASAAAYLVPDAPPVAPALDDPLADGFFDRLVDAGVDLDDGLTCYGYSKLGVIRLVRRTAAAWGPRGGRILSLSPGVVETPMSLQEAERNEIMHDVVKATPSGRWGRAEEVAAVVDFLTSDAASFMTGSDVAVDGGMIAMARQAPPAP